MPDAETIRIVTLDGKVSDDLWTIVRPADRNNLVLVEDQNGSRLSVDKRRILPSDAEGKAVAIGKAGAIAKAVCPKCTKPLTVDCARIDCPVHGVFETVNHHGVEPVNMVRRSKSNTRRPEPMTSNVQSTMSPEDIKKPKPDADVGAQVDLAAVKKFGAELWVKKQLNFDHVTMDVRAYALLADDPVRKLCFNTYNGTLGKKNVLKDLRLEDFKANKPSPDKKGWHTPKGTIDDARAALTKKGYEQA